jgi:phosphoribosyl-dephospho-CoA transferase
MEPLRRHRLARLTGEGWAGVLGRAWDAQARECLAHWAAHRLPLVVTRQSRGAGASDLVALGLPAPARWQRRRIALHVPESAVIGFEEFPGLGDVLPLLPVAARSPARDLLSALTACGATAHVYGSYGWQALSGLDHLRAGSDLDAWVRVDGAAHADAVADALHRFAAERPRLDGELLFADGSAVAWREWSDWRAGRARAVMVKRLTGATLEHDTTWCEGAGIVALAA